MADLTLQEREAQEAIDRILAHFGQEPDASSPADALPDGVQGEQRADAPQGPSNFGGVASCKLPFFRSPSFLPASVK